MVFFWKTQWFYQLFVLLGQQQPHRITSHRLASHRNRHIICLSFENAMVLLMYVCMWFEVGPNWDLTRHASLACAPLLLGPLKHRARRARPVRRSSTACPTCPDIPASFIIIMIIRFCFICICTYIYIYICIYCNISTQKQNKKKKWFVAGALVLRWWTGTPPPSAAAFIRNWIRHGSLSCAPLLLGPLKHQTIVIPQKTIKSRGARENHC